MIQIDYDKIIQRMKIVTYMIAIFGALYAIFHFIEMANRNTDAMIDMTKKVDFICERMTRHDSAYHSTLHDIENIRQNINAYNKSIDELSERIEKTNRIFMKYISSDKSLTSAEFYRYMEDVGNGKKISRQ